MKSRYRPIKIGDYAILLRYNLFEIMYPGLVRYVDGSLRRIMTGHDKVRVMAIDLDHSVGPVVGLSVQQQSGRFDTIWTVANVITGIEKRTKRNPYAMS